MLKAIILALLKQVGSVDLPEILVERGIKTIRLKVIIINELKE